VVITDGIDFVKELKPIEQLEAEMLIRFLNLREADRATRKVKPEFQVKFQKKMRRKIETYFDYIVKLYSDHLKKVGHGQTDEGLERFRTFKAEAARIKNSEYTAKIEGRATP
jgi:hypothetical protein